RSARRRAAAARRIAAAARRRSRSRQRPRRPWNRLRSVPHRSPCRGSKISQGMKSLTAVVLISEGRLPLPNFREENEMRKSFIFMSTALALTAAPAQAQLLGGVTGAVNGTLGGTVGGTLNSVGSVG